jgi:streptomycin 6-kinase
LRAISIPRRLLCAVQEDDLPSRRAWLDALPATIEQLAARWSLELGPPSLPGGQCAWVAPARDRRGRELILKVGWRHLEAEHEADALRLWDGDGAVRCLAAEVYEHTSALLLERCVPGTPLGSVATEPEQDLVVATLLRRLWAHRPSGDSHPFRPLHVMCDEWAARVDGAHGLAEGAHGLAGEGAHGLAEGAHGLAGEGAALLRELSRTAEREVLLCTDLHAENILASDREPWLVIDPKPFVGDPAYDVVQHMLNCDERLATDPAGMAERLAGLLDLDPERVKLWLFARCAQESPNYPALREPARRLAPA